MTNGTLVEQVSVAGFAVVPGAADQGRVALLGGAAAAVHVPLRHPPVRAHGPHPGPAAARVPQVLHRPGQFLMMPRPPSLSSIINLFSYL